MRTARCCISEPGDMPRDQTVRVIAGAECAHLEILRELEPDARQRIAAQCTVAMFREGETILRQGSQNDLLHFVLSGRVLVLLDIADRSQPIEIGAGRVFGEMSVIDGLPTSAHVIAAEPCRILRLPADVFWRDTVTVPGVARALMRALSRRVRDDSTALTEAIRQRLRHEALQRELHLARDIQMGMLRQADDWFPGATAFAISAHTQPAKLVGGDFYDAFLLDPDHLVLMIGDVAGKGISAALFMVRALTLLRSAAMHWTSLSHAAAGVNQALAGDNDASMFLTLFLAVLELRSGTLDYVNFGHVPPLIRGHDGAVACQPLAAGVVFGLMEDATGAAGSLTLAPGATLILYTDGVTEARDAHDRLFGLEGLIDAANSAPAGHPAAMTKHVAAGVAGHIGGTEQDDDITMLAVTFAGGSAGR